jgi:colanic acid/amylovoran biosynthesis glycosyltransferase
VTPPTPGARSIRTFYDDFSASLLADYAHGNPRIEAAIQHALAWVASGAAAVLDIGCGVGWSTSEIHRAFPQASVLGVDLSPTAVQIAQQLFQSGDIRFEVADVTSRGWAERSTFDSIVMLDVYEHIPVAARTQLNAALATLLGPDGRIILSFPSASHQEYLATHHAEALQPIDEVISRLVLEELAREIDGDVVSFEPVTIWRPNDYVHAAIARRKGLAHRGRSARKLEPKSQRRERVSTSLGLRATRDGHLIPRRVGPVALVVSPTRDAYSLTFVKAHIERLPTPIEVLFGTYPNLEDENGDRLVPRWASRLARAAALVGPLSRWLKEAWFDRFLQSRHVEVVLAEFGWTGVQLQEACARRRIPLVTYFHGADITDRRELDEFASRYSNLLSTGHSIAASRDIKQRLIALGAAPEAVAWIPCGADTDGPLADPSLAPPRFIAVGRFTEKKAPHLTLLAFKEVLRTVPDAELWFVGDGVLLDSSKELAAALRMHGSVTFFGAQPHGRVLEMMRECRGFVQHSVVAPSGDSEGTPVAILEAGAAGLPVVSTRHGGIVDVVVDGITGYLVDEYDVTAMARHMADLAVDRELAARVGASARGHVAEHFSQTHSLDALWEVLRGSMASEVAARSSSR